MCMARQMLNNESVHVTVFDPENDVIQIIFQLYALDDVSDCYEYQVIKVNIVQPIKNYLNMSGGT